MLIEFRIKNFRSFMDENVFSLVASSDKTNESKNVNKTNVRSIPRVLKTTAIYGANASGKSNLIRAIQLLRAIVADSAGLQPNQELNVQPFRLNSKNENDPIEFEVTFLKNKVRYQFGFSLTAKQIINEWLIVYKTNQPQSWYSRNFDPDRNSYTYKFGSHMRGAKALWKNATRPNSLFLSMATQLNSEQLKPIFDLITQNLIVFERGAIPMMDYTVDHIAKNGADTVKKFLAAADVGIDDIQLKSTPHTFKLMELDIAKGQIANPREEERDILVPTFLHTSSAGSAIFNFEDESEGTQKLFNLAGPLFNIFERGQVLIVDELDRSLHPLLVYQLIEMFQDQEINKNNAQLIFTTHNTSILTNTLLRRDQIWFTEKANNQASKLFPLTNFALRKSEAIERGYLSGRYGALPILTPLRT